MYPNSIYPSTMQYPYTQRYINANHVSRELLDNFSNYDEDDNLQKASSQFPDTLCTICLQSEEKAPAIIKACISSMRNLYPQLVVLTQENYSNYVKLSNNVIELYNEGKILSATFSDILRFAYLYEYGGYYIDCTAFLFQKLPVLPPLASWDKKSKLRISCVGGVKNHPFFKAYCESMSDFLKNNKPKIYATNELFLNYVHEKKPSLETCVKNCNKIDNVELSSNFLLEQFEGWSLFPKYFYKFSAGFFNNKLENIPAGSNAEAMIKRELNG